MKKLLLIILGVLIAIVTLLFSSPSNEQPGGTEKGGGESITQSTDGGSQRFDLLADVDNFPSESLRQVCYTFTKF
ncbi:hypothetical protein [uncultured Imperialibacter sp.]|uniref:hypothetical protein n=1 Tax=uncultured Imperialibacter sp. TaxID=1672639 RepID=UPI0030D9AB1B|tara:strand:- start:77133 stop:77357 length:225 start_codon:yes stop_codon:yes gene_type:complete